MKHDVIMRQLAVSILSAAKMRRSLVSVVAVLLPVLARLVAALDRVIYFGHITSFGSSGFNSSGALPAIQLAQDLINSDPGILSGYLLNSTQVMDSECDRTASLDAFFASVVYDEDSTRDKIAILGCGCSVATEPVAEISHRWNISHISYSSALAALSDRSRFRNYFRTFPSFEDLAPAIASLMRHFNWSRIAFITQEENLFTKALSDFRTEVKDTNITVIDRSFKTQQTDLGRNIRDIFGQSEDYRIFFLNMYSDKGREIICEAAKRGIQYSKYVWITYGWYATEWWLDTSVTQVDCTEEELVGALENSLIIDAHPTPEDENAVTVSGYTTKKYMEIYIKKKKDEGYSDTIVHTLAFDAVWALAIALNRTASQLDEMDYRNSDILECSKLQGSLNVSLDQFEYSNAQLACLLKKNMQRTLFDGVSGEVAFDVNGTRIQRKVKFLQYKREGTTLERNLVGIVKISADHRFVEQTPIYPDGVPSDGNPIEVTNVYQLWIVILFNILASVGVILTIACGIFNFIFRNKKIVRLSSPNLSYFLLAGALMMYIAIFIDFIITTDYTLLSVQCNSKLVLSALGYTLAFSTILTKMWRVYYIFHSPTTQKKVLKDLYLVAIVTFITAICAFLLFLGVVIPPLRPKPSLVDDREKGDGVNEQGVKVLNHVYQCYQKSSVPFYWLIIIFIYIGILQIVGIVLAFQTRRVRVPALNDSKQVAALIYISSISFLSIILITLGLGEFLNTRVSLFNTAIFITASTFVILTFLPKVMRLYKDPEGTRVFDKTNPSVQQAPAPASNSKHSSRELKALEDQSKGTKQDLNTMQ